VRVVQEVIRPRPLSTPAPTPSNIDNKEVLAVLYIVREEHGPGTSPRTIQYYVDNSTGSHKGLYEESHS
jgi:hypothetical protein